MRKIKIQHFEGPLDLLLNLIEDRELEISQISLAAVTDQYISLLRQAEDANPEELSDFLVVAAKLLLIKSKSLLPQLEKEAEDEGYRLEQQLKMYKAFLDASKEIQGQIATKRYSYYRETSILIEPVFNPPKKLKLADLAEVFKNVISEVEPYLAPPPEAVMRTVNIEEKINQIKNLIFDQSFVNFSTLLKTTKSKMDVIITFLALLELVKQRSVAVVQKDMFNEIEIQKEEERPI
ncbi:segregation and condensation protein A [Patescibacteria group bacterium]